MRVSNQTLINEMAKLTDKDMISKDKISKLEGTVKNLTLKLSDKQKINQNYED